MHHFEFVVGLVIVENFAGLLLPVSRKLQAVENDLTQAIKDVTEALSALENLRPEAGFQKIFAEASLLAEHHGIAVSSCKGVRCPPIFSLYNLINVGWL